MPEPRDLLFGSARLIDGTGAPPRDRVDVAVRGDRIAAVGPRLEAAGAQRIDCAGRTLMPGLVNADEYLALKGIAGSYYDVYRQSPHWQVLRASRNALYSLAQGITTVRDVGAIDGLNLVLRDAIAAEMVTGPAVYACGMPIAPTFDSPGVEPVGMTVEAADGAALLTCVEALLERGVDFVMIKMHREDFRAKRKRHFTVEELRPAHPARGPRTRRREHRAEPRGVGAQRALGHPRARGEAPRERAPLLRGRGHARDRDDVLRGQPRR